MFDKKIYEINVIQIKHYLYHWKAFETYISKMILHFLFEDELKVVMKRKVMGQIFQVALSPRGKSGLNCPME